MKEDLKEDLQYVREESKQTNKDLRSKSLGSEQAKAIAYNNANIIRACIAEIKYFKEKSKK